MNKTTIFTALLVATVFSSVNAAETEEAPVKFYANTKAIHRMCQAIHKKAQQDGFNPELLVGITRGGLMPLNFLAGEPMFNNRNIRTISLKSYADNNKQSAIELLCPIHIEDYQGVKSILIIDDLADTGKSLQFVLSHLSERLPTDVIIKTAALFYKKKSALKPDYYDDQTDAWVEFPWEEFKD